MKKGIALGVALVVAWLYPPIIFYLFLLFGAFEDPVFRSSRLK